MRTVLHKPVDGHSLPEISLNLAQETFTSLFPFFKRVGSVGTVEIYWMEKLGSSPGRGITCSLHHRFHTGSGVHPAF
jgi:hypothetical protein